MSEFILEMERIHKSFPGVQALKGVELHVRPGTVHGVMGENGAAQGRGAVQTAIKLVKGQSVPIFTAIPFEPVTYDNYKKYMK